MKNGPRDRAMRSVLLVIADAANGDGEHAHPGLSNIIDYSLYARAHVLATLDRLAEEGWIAVTGRRSPGRATTYRVCMERDEVQPVDLSEPARGPIQQSQRSNLDPSEVQSDYSHTSLTSSTVSTTVSLNASADCDDRVREAFDSLVERDFEGVEHKRHPRAVRRACRQERENDGSRDVLEELARRHPEWTAGALVDAVALAEELRSEPSILPDCAVCANTRWTNPDDGPVLRCPTCWPGIIESRRAS